MRSFTIKLSDIAACPTHSLSVEHYRDDGSCTHMNWKALLDYLDGRGLVVTDWDLIQEALETFDLNLNTQVNL